MDIWKENLLDDLETEEVEFGSAGEFLLELRKKFEEKDQELVKVAELREIEQKGKTIEEFIQEFWRAARGSGYEERALVEKFKRRINRAIRRKLIEAEKPPTSIEQWYEQTTNLDKY